MKIPVNPVINTDTDRTCHSVRINQPPVIQKVDNAMRRINHHPLDSAIIGFPNTYPLDSDLSDG